MWISKHQDISHLAPKTDVELLRAEQQTIRAEVAAAKLEMAELSDKAYHMLQRTAKRLRDAEGEPIVQEEPPVQPVVDEITQKILERRNRRALSQ